MLDEMYRSLGDLESAAKACLSNYGRDINFPLYKKGSNNHFSKEHIFEIYACNLISGVMDVAVPKYIDKTWKVTYHQISDITYERKPIEVYSLDVEWNHNYVADCILTHNSIYGFRGADSSIIKSLAENPEWTTIRLSENYRSTAQICDYSNDIHQSWKGNAYNLDIISTKQGCNVIEREQLNIDSNKEIMDIVGDAHDGKTVAILCRTNYEVADIKPRLEDLVIAFSTKDARKDISNILRCSIDSEYLVDWLSDKLTSNRYNEYLKLCSVSDSYKTDESFISIYGKHLVNYLNPIMKIREVLTNEQFAFGKIAKISDLLNLPNKEVVLDSDDNKSIIDYLIQISESEQASTGIYVGTIHSVKGLEYDVVHLVGVNGKSFPIDKDEDQQNLFYVGCTRAKEKLVIYNSDL